jgi:hypothetical protein
MSFFKWISLKAAVTYLGQNVVLQIDFFERVFESSERVTFDDGETSEFKGNGEQANPIIIH